MRFKITQEMAVVLMIGFLVLNLSMISFAQNVTYENNPDADSLQAEKYVRIQILGVNDFHGRLDSEKAVSGRLAGGADYLAAYLKRQKAENENTLIVHAGDMVGASEPASALFQDEPAVEFMNQIGFDVGIPGNHELDKGFGEMIRLIDGGYHPSTGYFSGADFPYISANMADSGTEKPILDPYIIKYVDGIPVAFIGVTLTDLSVFQDPKGLTGIEFTDEVDAVNMAVSELKKQNVKTIILLAHEDAFFDDKTQKVTGKLAVIAGNIDDEVDVIVAGHSHTCINGFVDGKLIVEALSGGIAFSDIDLEVDPITNDVVTKKAEIVTAYQDAMPADAAVTKLVNKYKARVKNLVDKPIAISDRSITKKQNPAGEAPLGDLIADAYRWKMQTDFAFTNSAGIRSDIKRGTITWGDLYTVQPFHNKLFKLILTGQQIRALLDQQFQTGKMLQISGLKYTWKDNATSDIYLEDGTTLIDPAASYTVAVNSFLVSGGDGFTIFEDVIGRESESTDFESLVEYLEQLPQPFSAFMKSRITKI